jgi:hypothetical protein
MSEIKIDGRVTVDQTELEDREFVCVNGHRFTHEMAKGICVHHTVMVDGRGTGMLCMKCLSRAWPEVCDLLVRECGAEPVVMVPR